LSEKTKNKTNTTSRVKTHYSDAHTSYTSLTGRRKSYQYNLSFLK